MIALLAAAALAAVVPELPADVTDIGVLVCADVATSCNAQAYEWSQRDGRPTLLVDALLALPGPADEAAVAFEARLAEARGHVAAGEWAPALHELDRAEAALRRSEATVPSEALFELYFLQGAALAETGDDGVGRFAQALAAAWNRDVTPPVRSEAIDHDWREALRRTGATGTLVLGPPPGLTYWLDGVELGASAAEIRVLPGQHRLTAKAGSGQDAWRATVTVRAGTITETTAVMGPSRDAEWLSDGLRAAAASGEADPALRDWLVARCEARGIGTITIVAVEPTRAGLAFRTAEFRASQRRVVR